MNKYYIFQVNGSKSLKPFEATVGKSLMNNTVSLSGYSFALSVENNGCLGLVKENKPFAKTSRIVEKQVYSGKDVDISFGRQTPYGVVVPEEIVVYKTQSGSEYVFVPENASLNCISMVQDVNQKDMEYLERVAEEYYDKTTIHPSPEGKEAFLDEVKKKANENGYHNTLSELKDMHNVMEKQTREQEPSINNSKMEL